MTTSSSELTPPLSKKPFFIADGVILLVAIFIAWTGPAVLGVPELLGIAACVGLGALLSVGPFVIDYTRREEAAFASRKAELVALSEQTTAALEKLHALSLERTAPTPLPATEPPASLEEFKALQTRLNAFESTLAKTTTTAQADLRQSLDERRAEEARAFTAFQASLQNALASVQQASAAQAGTLLASIRTGATEEHESTVRALTEAALATRQELTVSTERLASRLDEQWSTALSALENNLTATIRRHVAAEFAEEKAAAARRSVATATLSLEPTPGATPSGKSRLGRGLESLITSPQAKPGVTAEPTDAQLPIPSLDTNTPAPAPALLAPPLLITAVSEKPTPQLEAPSPKHQPSATVLDPFHIPVNGYADLAQAMDISYEKAHSPGSR